MARGDSVEEQLSGDPQESENEGDSNRVDSGYINRIDSAFRAKYGRGIPGEVFDRLKVDRSFADEFMGYINTAQDDLLSSTGTQRQKLKNLGFISDDELIEFQNKKEQTEIEAKEKSDAGKIEELLSGFTQQRGELLSELEKEGLGLASQSRETRKQRLSELQGILQGEQERVFNENAPDILEQLSGRGLLHSSATGQALAKEKSRLGTITSETLRKQALADLDDELRQKEKLSDILSGIKTQGYGTEQSIRLGGLDLGRELAKLSLQSQADLGRGALERTFSKEDRDLNLQYGLKAAEENAAATRDAGLYSGIGNILGLGILRLSDEKAKKDTKKIGELGNMGLYKFKYKEGMGDQKEHVGFMAQEVEKKAPGAVFENKGDGMKHIDMNKLNEYLDNFLAS